MSICALAIEGASAATALLRVSEIALTKQRGETAGAEKRRRPILRHTREGSHETKIHED